MSLLITVYLEVSGLGSEEIKLLRIVRTDTSINPEPDDAQGEVLLTARLTERLLGEVSEEAAVRFRELLQAVTKV